MNRGRLLVILFLLAAGVGVVAWIAWSGGSASSIKLPDGSRLTLSGASIGPNSTHFYGTYLQGITEKLSARLGKRIFRGARYSASVGDETNVVFWFRLQGNPTAAAQLLFVIIDDEGNSALVRPPASVHPLPAGGAAVFISQVPWPRRSGSITVRVFDGLPGREQKVLGEIRVPNPAPRSYPQWSADPLPISRREGNAVFILERFVLRPKPTFQRLHGTNVKDLLAAVTFRVAGDSPAQTNEWVLWQARVSDATGNSHLWGWDQRKTVGGTLSFHDQGMPWLGEKACKVETIWFPVQSYAAEELFVVRGVVLEPPMNTSGLVWRGELPAGGVHRYAPVQLYASRDQYEAEPRWRLRAVGSETRAAWNDSQPRRAIIVAVRDERGRDWPGEHRGEMQLPIDATTVDVTFAMPAGRVVEFIASPERLATIVPLRRPSQ